MVRSGLGQPEGEKESELTFPPRGKKVPAHSAQAWETGSQALTVPGSIPVARRGQEMLGKQRQGQRAVAPPWG